MARARKKKPKPFRAVKAVKALAREKIGAPPPTRAKPVVRKSKEEKHPPTLGRMLQELE